MRILVLGATGHVGQAVVRRALVQGHGVTATSRRADPAALGGLRASIERVDDALHGLTELAAGHDQIVDAAAPYPLEACFPGSESWRGAIGRAMDRTERVLDAARSNRVPLAFVSSFTTLPRNEPPWRAWETMWRRSLYPYFEAKAAMEAMVLAAARQGLPAVVVNPCACLGPWEFRAQSFVRLVRERRLPLVLNHVLSVVDVRDVALAIEQALAREYFGRPIPLAGHNVALPELASRVTALDGGGAVPLGIDSSWASAGAFWAGTASAAWGLAVPDIWRAVTLTADCYPMQPSPEQIALGLRLRPLDETLRDAVAFHRGRQLR